MLPTEKSAKRHDEGRSNRRQDALVDRRAGFEAMDRAGQDAGCRRQLIDAVTGGDTKPEDARRQWFYVGDSLVSVAPLGVRRRRTLEHHRLAFMQ